MVLYCVEPKNLNKLFKIAITFRLSFTVVRKVLITLYLSVKFRLVHHLVQHLFAELGESKVVATLSALYSTCPMFS